jgi:hypothetical protein
MKIQHLLLTMALPALLILAGCEATQPTIQANAEPELIAAPAAKSETVVPAATTTNHEHCGKHVKHDCIRHCAKHKGKKNKACQKHCETTVSAHHDCAKHCTENPDVKDQACTHHHALATPHCSHHHGTDAHACGKEMSKCHESEHKCDK